MESHLTNLDKQRVVQEIPPVVELYGLPAPPRSFMFAGGGWAYGIGCGVGPFLGVGVAMANGVLFGAGTGIGAFCGVGFGAGAIVGNGSAYVPYGVNTSYVVKEPWIAVVLLTEEFVWQIFLVSRELTRVECVCECKFGETHKMKSLLSNAASSFRPDLCGQKELFRHIIDALIAKGRMSVVEDNVGDRCGYLTGFNDDFPA